LIQLANLKYDLTPPHRIVLVVEMLRRRRKFNNDPAAIVAITTIINKLSRIHRIRPRHPSGTSIDFEFHGCISDFII
jgi:hypothetical protein